jgi:hypothetical protein
MKSIKIKEFIEKLESGSYDKEIFLLDADLIVEETYKDENGDDCVREVHCKLGNCTSETTRILRLMGRCYNLTSLVLDNQNLKPKDLADIAEIVTSRTNLTLLRLNKNPLFSNQYHEYIQDFFGRILSQNLEQLSIRKCELTDHALTSLGRSLETNTSLKKLYVGKKHSYSLDAFRRFVQSLEKNTTLVECYIDIRTIHFLERRALKRKINGILIRNRQLQKKPQAAQSTTLTTATSPAFFKNNQSIAIDSSIPKSSSREQLSDLANALVNDLIDNNINLEEATNAVITALKALGDGEWEAVRYNKSKRYKIQQDVRPLINSFIKENPVLLTVSEDPRAVKKVCNNLLKSLATESAASAHSLSSYSKKSREPL